MLEQEAAHSHHILSHSSSIFLRFLDHCPPFSNIPTNSSFVFDVRSPSVLIFYKLGGLTDRKQELFQSLRLPVPGCCFPAPSHPKPRKERQPVGILFSKGIIKPSSVVYSLYLSARGVLQSPLEQHLNDFFQHPLLIP